MAMIRILTKFSKEKLMPRACGQFLKRKIDA
jgi:hypothetical protein